MPGEMHRRVQRALIEQGKALGLEALAEYTPPLIPENVITLAMTSHGSLEIYRRT
ncbi:MAG: hypothetical protein F7C34_05010 [Desulfurococcales archaeon]|nr:hypothetical protein [Desulfurococcales archaeon]